MPLRRPVLLSCLALVAFLSCGKAPRTFDLVAPRGPVQKLSQPVNVTAAGDEALSFRRELVAFIAAGIHAKEQPLSLLVEPSSVVSPPTLQTTVPAATSSGLEPCGGDLPPCFVKQRESGGDYAAYNPSGCGGFSCGGAWQFDPRTWNNYGGYEFAQDAPPELQDAKARELWAMGAGGSHWGF